MKIKYLEKSYSTLTFNWKEENLLKKKLSLLEFLKKHEARNWLVEQRALYSRYCKTLWRSELAYARLLGNKNMVRQLTKEEFSSPQSTMMTGGEPVLMVLAQNRRHLRKTPLPGYLGPSGDTFSPAINGGLLVKEKENKKDLNGSLEASKRKLNPDPKQSSLKMNLGRRKFTAHQEWGSLDKQIQFYLQRSHKGKEQEGQKRKSISADYSSHFNQRLPRPPNQQRPATTHTGRDVQIDGQAPAIGRPKDKFLGCQHYSGNKECRYLAKSRPSSRRVFLGEEEATSYMPLRAEIQAMMNKKPHFKEKVKHYLRKVVIPPLHVPLSGDYTKGLQEKGGQDSCYVLDSRVDVEQEWRKWLPVGPESSSRSITLKKLDWCFVQKTSSPVILFLETYNAILTKENQMKRNWFHNNPDCSTTKLPSIFPK